MERTRGSFQAMYCASSKYSAWRAGLTPRYGLGGLVSYPYSVK